MILITSQFKMCILLLYYYFILITTAISISLPINVFTYVAYLKPRIILFSCVANIYCIVLLVQNIVLLYSFYFLYKVLRFSHKMLKLQTMNSTVEIIVNTVWLIWQFQIETSATQMKELQEIHRHLSIWVVIKQYQG